MTSMADRLESTLRKSEEISPRQINYLRWHERFCSLWWPRIQNAALEPRMPIRVGIDVIAG